MILISLALLWDCAVCRTSLGTLNSVRMLRRAALVSANRCAAARHMSSQPPGSPDADERETFATVSGGDSSEISLNGVAYRVASY